MRALWQLTIRPLTVALAGLLAVTALSACKATQNPLGSKDFVYCTLLADPPQPSGHKILGPAHFTCDNPGADSITLTVTLQQVGAAGKWVTLATDTFVVHGKDTARSPDQGKRTRSVSAACAKGQFRTKMHAVEDSKGKSQTVNNNSVTISNPCRL